MNLILENVQPKHISLINELAKTLHFNVRKDNAKIGVRKKLFTAEQQEFIDDLKESLHEVELHQQGKIELQFAHDFLSELREEAK